MTGATTYLTIVLSSLALVLVGAVAISVRRKTRIRIQRLERDISTERSLHRTTKSALEQAKSALDHKVLEQTASLELSYMQLTEAQKTLKTDNEQLDQLAHLDALTGLANRRYFDHVLDHELRRARREKQPLTLLLCDVDHFKHLNNSHGHQHGDYVIKKSADLIRRQFPRAGDLVARISGEAFAVILPATDKPNALSLAEQVREALWNSNLEHAANPAADRVTISIGGATAPTEQSLLVNDVFQAAEQALHDAKNAGRNRVAVVDIEPII